MDLTGGSDDTANTSGIRPDTPAQAEELRKAQKAAAVPRAMHGLDESGMYVLPKPPYRPKPVEVDADPTVVATRQNRRGGEQPSTS